MSVTGADSRWDVPTAEELKRLAAEPLPLGVRAAPATRTFFRDLYYDTSDSELQARHVTCRIRYHADDRRQLTVSVLEGGDGDGSLVRAQADVAGLADREILEGASQPARVLRGIVSPASLGVQLELETEHFARSARSGWLRPARFDLEYDIVTVRAAGLSRSFQEIVLEARRNGRPTVEQMSRAMSEAYRLRSVSLDRRGRGLQLQAALESEALARNVGSGRWVVAVALDGPRIAALADADTVRLPVAEGSGEAACRHVMRKFLGSAVGELRLLTSVRGDGRLRSVEVWIATRVDRSAISAHESGVTWMPVERLLAMVGSSAITDAATLAALAELGRSGELPRLIAVQPTASRSGESPARPTPTPESRDADAADDEAAEAADDAALLDGAMSLLAFNTRVLELAENPRTPLLERVRFLAIVSANLDEFFAVQVGGLKHDSAESADEGMRTLSPVDRLAAILGGARSIAARQAVCAAECERQLAAQGIAVRAVADATPEEDRFLRDYFRSTVLPYLTPRAITVTPGHSLPVIADQALAFAVVLRESASGDPLHLAELTVPAALPRFIPLPGGTAFVPIEDLIRCEVHLAYPGRRVRGAYLFRLTRYADLALDDGQSGDLAQTIEERSQRRRHQPVVRVEVEAAMPAAIRAHLLRELQLEPGATRGALGSGDVHAVPGRVDLRGMTELADLPRPELRFPPFRPRPALAEGATWWETLRARDVLLHHPYDAFASSVVRFFEDAADDPDVVSIRVTLYRVGERSPIVDAMLRAAAAGKDVTVFVELKARFDEERNVLWARRLEKAGAHVVHGMAGLKNHSKMALVVRRENGSPRRYAHVGTGNYNAATSRVYTDLGLLTARDDVCADVNDLFNTLTGSSVPADVSFRQCLVSPNALLPQLLERIDRESRHARAGRGGRIRMKMNGLSDREVVRALYRAAKAGVDIDLVVRGICTLRPQVPGVSQRVRVVSVLGRFLEHARIYYFANDGSPEYFIGSADLRPRNLRRRVEVLVPVVDAAQRGRLDAILDAELGDTTAWELGPDGTYAWRNPTTEVGDAAQAQFMAQVESAPVAAPA